MDEVVELWIVAHLAFGSSAPANAGATIDLLWGGVSPTTSSVETSSLLTLDVILTAGPGGVGGVAVTVDYSSAVGILSVVQFTANAGGFTRPFDTLFGPAVDTGSQVRNVNANCFPNNGLCFFGATLDASLSYLVGTVTFHLEKLDPGVFPIIPILTATDGLFDQALNNIGDSTTFNPAILVTAAVPEPATGLLFGVGLVALSLAGRLRISLIVNG